MFHVIGNCQAFVVKEVLSKITKLDSAAYIISGNKSDHYAVLERILNDNDNEEAIVVFQYDERITYLIQKLVDAGIRAIEFPKIASNAHNPDCVYVSSGAVKSPIGDYHSFILLTSYLSGLNEQEAIARYNSETFAKFGYSTIFNQSVENLISEMKGYGVQEEVVRSWLSREQFMFSVNHPKNFVVQDVLKSILFNNNIEFNDINTELFLGDTLLRGPIFFPMFNALGEANIGPYFFKRSNKLGGEVISLESFVNESYSIYRDTELSLLKTERLRADGLSTYKTILRDNKLGRAKSHPYEGKPDYCFWKRSISRIKSEDVDPVVNFPLVISDVDKIATGGSCFAQHIAKRLSNSGYNYYVPESAPDCISEQESHERGFGVFSCRYGNLYTTRQLLQLIQRAYGDFEPSLSSWKRPDGKFVDPFRPTIEPAGYLSEAAVIASRESHLQKVREMFDNLDVFVFTLGLTECWEYKADGSILPLAPGITGGKMDPKKYQYRNFSKDEVESDLELFLDKLKSINPSANVILTVSPVPLMATYEDRHVLTSTTVSKSILRTVVDEVSNRRYNVHYFPSYEIITGNFNRGNYYSQDLREVTTQGVDHVMRLFMKHATNNVSTSKERNEKTCNILPDVKKSEIDSLNDIICDEEYLDKN